MILKINTMNKLASRLFVAIIILAIMILSIYYAGYYRGLNVLGVIALAVAIVACVFKKAIYGWASAFLLVIYFIFSMMTIAE